MKFVSAFIIWSLSISPVLSQNSFIIQDSIYSQIFEQQRKFNVLVPEINDSGSKQKFSSIYLLAGGAATFNLVANCQNFLVDDGYMQPAVIVSVNLARFRYELTPTVVDTNSGGALKLLSFLRQELIPYINHNFPTNNENILYGHSLGGLFTMFTLLEEPQLFSTYICVDPSFWWEDEYIHKMAENTLHSLSGLNRSLFSS